MTLQFFEYFRSVCVCVYVSMYVGGGVWVCVFMRKSDSNYQFYLDHPVMVQVQVRARKMILKCNTYIFTSATLPLTGHYNIFIGYLFGQFYVLIVEKVHYGF